MPIPEITSLRERFKLNKAEVDERMENLPATSWSYKRLVNLMRSKGVDNNVPRSISERDARFLIRLYQNE